MEEKLPLHFEPVLRTIRPGKKNATTVSDIHKLTGYDKDIIRHIVSKAVTQYGIGIATSTSGYYYITNSDEKLATSRNLRSRAFRLLERANMIDNLPAEGQQEIDFEKLFA